MNEDYMEVAIKEARKGIKLGQSPFGCCIVKNDIVIAKAYNTVLKTKIATRHAEINAIEKACRKLKSWDLTGCQIYITTQSCPLCASAIHWARIQKVYYGTNIKDAEEFGFNELDMEISKNILEKLKVESGILREKCYKLFLEYEAKDGEKY